MKRRQFLQMTAAASASASVGALGSADIGRPSVDAAGGLTWTPRSNIAKPNILIVVLDDVGFADLGCYGAEHRTRCIDALATAGQRFTNFHVTALCAPTRACLMTGRNAHAVGVGNIAEWGRDLPAYQGVINKNAATLAEILRDDGYVTLAVGKWHLSAIHDQNASGPFGQWPTGRGFDRWYGFHGNAMDHWHPEMFENTVAAYPDKGPDYHLSNDLVDHSISYVKDHIAASTGRPFFLYLAFGACHFPFHVPKDLIDRQRGRYRVGWDVIRAQRFASQTGLGICPPKTQLAPRNPGVPAWSDLTATQRTIAEHGQEVYAAFLEHTDAQLARLIDFLRLEDELNDTLLVLLSDNGAAGGGGTVEGLLDVRRAYYDDVTFEETAETFHLLGSEQSYGMYGSGWAQASNTPLKWYKADTHGGGTRAPLIVSWPAGGLSSGGIRPQYAHVVDIAPSLLEMINKPPPNSVAERPIAPMQGVSFAHVLEHEAAPTHKRVQYFETAGDRAVWAAGWKAVTKHVAGGDYDEDIWELYHADEDFAEIRDLAQAHPRKLKELIALWRTEAQRDGVVPMADDLFSLYEQVVVAPRGKYVFYPGMTRVDRLSAPDILSYNAMFRAEVSLDTDRENGLILASGDSGAGYEWLMRDGYLEFHYVYTRRQLHSVRSQQRIRPQVRTLGLDIARLPAKAHRCRLLADGRPVGELHLPQLWQVYSPNSGIRCGENRHSPISGLYSGPFAFTGKLRRVVVELEGQFGRGRLPLKARGVWEN